MADIRLDIGVKDLDKAAQLLKEMKKAAESIRRSLKQTGQALQPDLAQAKSMAKATKRLVTEKQKLTAVEKEQLRQERALATVEAKLQLANSKTNRTLLEKQKQLRKVNAEIRNGGKATNTWSKAMGSFQFKFNALCNIASVVMSNITRVVRQGMREAIQTIKDFDQAMADVRSITRAGDADFKALSKSARELGASTKFTAVQVAGLQKEFSKLGFSTKEILNAEEATLNLAAATNTDLARAAEVAGITLRQFGLNADQTQRVTDVMARSFTSSALDMEKFADAMKYVGPAAKASGLSIEYTTAMLGQLADAGISGSQAGTSLRQIMLALSKGTGTFAEKVAAATEGELDLAGATEEVQKRAATSLLVLKDGIGTIDQFTESLVNAGGAAKEMADVQLDTLTGQLTILNSAWDGLILAIGSSETKFSVIKLYLATIADSLNRMADNADDTAEEMTFLQKNWAIFKDQLVKTLPLIGVHRYQMDAFKVAIEEFNDEIERSNRENLLTDFGDNIKYVGNQIKKFGTDIWRSLFPKKELDNLDDLVKKLSEYGEDISEDGGLEPWMSSGLMDAATQYYIDKNNERFKSVEERARENLETMIKMRDEERDAYIKAAEEERKAEEKKHKQKIEMSLAAAHQLESLNDNLSSILEKQKEKELSAVGDNARRRLAIEKEYARKEQLLAINKALIAGGVASAEAWEQYGWPYALIPQAIIAADVATQIATIKSAKFAKGGMVNGEPHSRGGVPIEAEGGEFIINKRSTAKYKDLVEAINKDDQMRIMSAMARDKKIEISKGSDPYTKKMYELMARQRSYGEDNEFYYQHKGNLTVKIKKN